NERQQHAECEKYPSVHNCSGSSICGCFADHKKPQGLCGYNGEIDSTYPQLLFDANKVRWQPCNERLGRGIPHGISFFMGIGCGLSAVAARNSNLELFRLHCQTDMVQANANHESAAGRGSQ